VKSTQIILPFALAPYLVCIASCGAPQLAVSGTVTVDGQPLEEGTIHFQPADFDAKGTGGMVRQGSFTLSRHTLVPGKYRVSVDGFRKTGRMVADPQRGEVAETVPMSFQNSPMQIEVTKQNSGNLQIALETSA
jgi:hypothetical protein